MSFASPELRRLRAAAHRSLLVLLTMVTALGLTACPGDDDPADEDDDDIQGTWVFDDATGTVFLRITAFEIDVYFNAGDGTCFIREDYDITDVSGDVYTVAAADDPSFTFDVEISRSGDDLTLEIGNETITYESSSQNLASLEICSNEVPNLPACSTLPQIAVGGSANGTLAPSDPQNPDGSRYDLYRIQLAATTNVRIDMTSSAVDAYLGLLTDDSFIADNDDRDATTTDARIQQSLTAGCYIVMATSFAANEIGTYSVNVSTF